MSDYINKLPNELLLLIFNRIPLSDLLPLDQICSRWSALLPTVFESRRTLVLIGGELPLNEMQFDIPFNDDYQLSFDAYPYYDLSVQDRAASITWPTLSGYVSFEDYLEYDYDESEGFFDILYSMEIGGPVQEENFTELGRLYAAFESQDHLGTYFSNLLPNLNKLVVIYPECNEQDLYLLCKLVGSCLPSLVSLKLWIFCYRFDYKYRARPDQHPVRLLLGTIAQQSSTLQELSLEISADDEVDLPEETFAFNIAECKVVKLLFARYDFHQWDAWDSVIRSNCGNLTQIGLGDSFHVPILLYPQFGFSHKVTQLYWESPFDTVEELSLFVGRHSSLRMLRMDWAGNMSFAHLISNLASLKQLTHLHLSISFDQHQQNAFESMMARADEGNKQETPRISLPSVRILTLDIYKRSHTEFEFLSPGVFPSVEAIMLKDQTSSCTTCQLDGQHGLGTGQCHRQLVLSIKNKFVINSKLRLYSLQGVDYEPRIWHDWSMYLHRQDDDFPLIADLEDGLPAFEGRRRSW